MIGNLANRPCTSTGLAGGDGDYLLPHQDVKEKHTNVITSVMWGATLLFWRHGTKMKARHAAEEEGVIGLVDIDGGRVLDEMMGSARMGATCYPHPQDADDGQQAGAC